MAKTWYYRPETLVEKFGIDHEFVRIWGREVATDYVRRAILPTRRRERELVRQARRRAGRRSFEPGCCEDDVYWVTEGWSAPPF